MLSTGCVLHIDDDPYDDKVVEGNGRLESKHYGLSDAIALEVEDEFDVTVSVDPNFVGRAELRLTAEENLLRYIDVGQGARRLSLAFASGVSMHNSQAVAAEIRVATLESIIADDDVFVRVGGAHGPSLRIMASDAAEVVVQGQVDRLIIDGDDAALIELAGRGVDLEADMVDGAELRAANFPVARARAYAEDGGVIDLCVSRSLRATAVDEGHISYRCGASDVNLVEGDEGRIEAIP